MPLSRFGRTDQHRHDQPFRQFAAQIVAHFVARRLDVGEQFLHQVLVVIGELLEHLEARFLLAFLHSPFELDQLGWLVLAIDKGALEREIDEAGDDAVLPDRNLAQQQRLVARLLQHAEQIAQRAVALSILLTNRKCGMPRSASRFR